ncbi:MAG TPA: RNA polymerase sigma factor [Verrucomicrobiae bacterium]|nr:RNA polymerase sigma factor [Verrucomicrobiae bacterium]
MTAEEFTDTELVARSLAGDREAFSRIVTRYQILICSLAYSRIGHLGQSEDVAQETFITAWKRLRLLREPAKLRAWLCGIVNYRIHKALRREGREPVRQAETLEIIEESPAVEALPSEQAISREEEAILWRALEKVPELYRQPLVLFYREHESIEAVAAELDLTEDAVKQRLSRGRKLLQEEVQSFVESTLRRTAPGQAFSGAVLAALPMAPAATVSAVAGKSAAAAKSGLLGAWLAVLAPFIGIVLGVLSQWLIIRSTLPAGRERRARSFELFAVWTCVIGLAWGGEAAVRTLGHHFEWSDRTLFCALSCFWWLYVTGLIAWFMATARRDLASRQKHEAAGEIARISPGLRAGLSAGMHLAMFSWVITLAWNAHDRMGAGVIAGMTIGLAVWSFFKMRKLSGLAAARAGGQHASLCCLLVLAVLNLRMDVWLSSHYEVGVTEIHQMFPMWLIPVLTAALLGWVGLLMAMHNRHAPQNETVRAD